MPKSVELVFETHDPSALKPILDRVVRLTHSPYTTVELRGEVVMNLTGVADAIVESLHLRMVRSRIGRLANGITLRRQL